MSDPRHAGFAIKVMRESQDLTLRELAALAQTSASYISQVERGIREPSHRWLTAVKAALARNMRGVA